jgi:hypothetical protein
MLLILGKHSIKSNIDRRQLCSLDLSIYLVLKVANELNYYCEHYSCLMVIIKT